MKKRVVITGIGAVTPIGTGIGKYFESLKSGKVGIDAITAFDASELVTKIAGEVKDFDPEDYIDKKEAKRMDRFTQFAVVAAKEAVEDSGIIPENIDRDRYGVVLGSGIGGIKTMAEEHEKLLTRGPKRVSPFMTPMMICNMASGRVSMELGAKGPNYTIVTACASSTNAIGDAYKLIERGDADIMVTGGCEASVTYLGVAGFCSLKAMSTRNDDPLHASSPFDKNRDGFVMGEGAGILILEDYEHAKKRGAKIYAEIAGFGLSGDAHHMTMPAPGGEGAARAMKMAIRDAGIKPEDITYVNAHGTSTPYNDLYETMAIKSVFGDHAYKLYINSTKSMTGHLLGASGAVEALACIMSIRDGYIHGTMGFVTPDPELDLNYLHNGGVSADVEYALSNSLGFGGHNATVIIKKYKQ